MLTRILSVLPQGTPKFPLQYRRMITSMTDRLNYLKVRYIYAAPYQTYGMELLRFFILNLDMENLDSYKSDIERYTDVIKFYKQPKLQAFDPVVNGKIAGGRLFRPRPGGMPPEIWLNVDCDDPLNCYPMDQPWEQWKSLRGVRLLYHDSLEMLDEFNNSLLNFKKEQPTALVVSLDVATLVFKYYKYWKDCKKRNVEPDVNKFLKEYEYTHFFEDMFNIWILNFLAYMFSHPEVDEQSVLDRLTIPVRVATDHMLLQGIRGTKEFIGLVKANTLRMADFLQVKWFPDMTIEDKLKELKTWCSLPDRRNYLWCNALVWYPYLRFFVQVMGLSPDDALTNLIKERCNELYWKRFKYINMPGIAYGEKLKELVKRFDDDIEKLLTNSGS
jgi:hypothetical protein